MPIKYTVPVILDRDVIEDVRIYISKGKVTVECTIKSYDALGRVVSSRTYQVPNPAQLIARHIANPNALIQDIEATYIGRDSRLVLVPTSGLEWASGVNYGLDEEPQ